MLTPKRITWFLVADGAKARLFESYGPKAPWDRKGEWSDAGARAPSRELGRDRPARGRTIGTGAPFAVEAPASLHDKAEEAFLAARAEELNQANSNDDFDQLAIAAAPAALGHLRKKLAAEVTAKLIGLFDKDLTNMADQDLHVYFLDKLERW